MMQRHDERTQALIGIVGELTAVDGARKLLAGLISGLDVRYELGEGHPLLGRRMPDLDLTTNDGSTRVFALLHEARPLLLDLDGESRLDVGPWADRVRHVRAHHEGGLELPVIGTVDVPEAALVRPDGHVAWVGDGTDAGLADALATWFGP
jgi:3-(3-hydroxy-phenyl)propionate hydroxylase